MWIWSHARQPILGKGRLHFVSACRREISVMYSALLSQNGALLTFWLKVFVQNSTLHGVVYTESIRESGEMSYISAQSRKSSFHKIQIFDCAYSALPPFLYSLFRFKNHVCIEWYVWKGLKKRKRLVASRYSLLSARFTKYRFSNLHILHFRCFIPYLGSNLITASSFI